MRYFLRLAYDGTAYHGWQVQPGATTVQQLVEEKLALLLRQPTPITGSGRTDAGVHASDQWAHFDTDAPLPENMVYRLNCLLPPDIGIQGLYRPASPTLHARFDATRRQYRYLIARTKDPLLRHQSLLHTAPLHAEAMQEAAQVLLQHTDFASFCKAGGQQHTTLCTMHLSQWTFEPHLWTYRVAANRFLRGMVRAIVGTLLEVGQGKLQPTDVHALLLAKDRRLAGRAVHPGGLCLEQVLYPEGALLPIAQ